MQRQSLGCPASKLLPIHGAAEEDDDDDDKKKKIKKKGGLEEEEIKAEKPTIRWSSSATVSTAAAVTTKRSIHLIPLLTLLCFLVLYLCSHDPSPSDLPDFGSVGRLFDPKVSGGVIGRYVEAGRGDVSAASAIRSHRSLKEVEKRRGLHSRRLGRWRPL